MYRMSILYGMPDDPQGFRDYYYRHHIPIASKMSGLTGWKLTWIDQDAADPQDYILIADLYAESQEAMDRILASPQGRAARADLDNFVTGSVTFLSGTEEQVDH